MSVRLLERSLGDPAADLALDEALLTEAEQRRDAGDTLRLWELDRVVVVVGRSSRVADEVRLDTCAADGVPIVRRSSGGAAIVAGPGCLMYSLVLSFARRPALRMIDAAHRFVLETLSSGLARYVHDVHCRGMSDLAVGDRKVSGNSLRIVAEHLLYHGTLLYRFPIALADRYLQPPPRAPEYRAGRSHGEFLANLPLAGPMLRQALIESFDAREPRDDWPQALVERLVAMKYGRPEWNRRH